MYEYKVTGFKVAGPYELEDALNQWGKDGWQLKTALQLSAGEYALIWEKRKQ